MQIRHVIMTRFNLATPGREASFRNAPEWLETRFGLFERYCLPSLADQRLQDFRWLIFFDDETPAWARDRIEAARAVRPFTALYTRLFPAEGWRNAVLNLLGDDRGEALLTTNLDNDDGLARDYVSRLHAVAQEAWAGEPLGLNFTNGFVLSGKRLYAHRHVSNAFTNVMEPYDARLRTAPAIRHMELARAMRVVQIPGPGAWLQVVHGGNVSNKVRGRIVSAREGRERFARPLVEQAEDPSPAEWLADALLRQPLRGSRDLLVAAARAVIRAVGVRR